MKSLPLLGLSGLLTALALACADSDEAPPPRASEDAGDAAPADGGDDGGDAQADGGAADGAWFPADCTKGVLCTVPVDALDPRAILFALDVHGDDVTAVGTYGSVVELESGRWRASGVGAPDALHGVTTQGGARWTAASVASVFLRASGAAWAEHAPVDQDSYNPRTWGINGLFSEPTGSWVWAATATTCAPQRGSDGVGLVRLRKQPAGLDLETILRFEEPMSLCITMHALDGAGGKLWVAGDKGVLHAVTDLEAASPKVTPVASGTTSTLLGVWAEPTGHVFVVGKDGTVLHRAPGADAFVSLGEGVPQVAYHAVRGTSASDVWIAGEDATVMHYDGKQWSRVPIAGLGDRRPTLRAIAAVAPDRVWIAGDRVLLGRAKEDGRAP